MCPDLSSSRKIAFDRIKEAARNRSESVVRAFLPDGCREGQEWVAVNPTRPDHKRGSFKINLVTGKWSDFATGDRGGDLIALVAYVCQLSQGAAALRLADALGVDPHE